MGADMNTPTILSTKTKLGRKGQVYPDQRKKYTDSKTGRTVWQITDTPGLITKGQYATQNWQTPDGQWLVYGSQRGSEPGQHNLFKMNLKTGESIQLTESNKDMKPRWSHISPEGDEFYYVEDDNHFKVVNLETLEERSLCRVEGAVRPHQLSVSPDNKFIIDAIYFEKKKESGFLKGYGHLIRCALVIADTRTGQQHRLIDGNRPMNHVQYSPTDANLILYSHGGNWWYIQRMWLINADGTNNRPIFLQTNFEGAGHEFWGADGRTVYVFCSGGRQPQGLWAIDVHTGKEWCVLAGACRGHGTANPQQDRFVVNEICCNYADGLWMSKKGNPEPELLCQTGWRPNQKSYTGNSAHPRFLKDGKTVAFSSAKTGSGEVYLVEL